MYTKSPSFKAHEAALFRSFIPPKSVPTALTMNKQMCRGTVCLDWPILICNTLEYHSRWETRES